MADNFQNFEFLSHRNLELGRAPRGIKVTQFQKDFDARPRDAKTQKSVAACGRAGRPPFPPTSGWTWLELQSAPCCWAG